MPSASLKKLSFALGYTFKTTQLLEQALTHRSLKAIHNERLEFLGDAVLGLVITTALFQKHPMASEGELSSMRASLVCEKMLVTLAREFQLADYIRVGTSVLTLQSKKQPSLLANALEAIIGAIYLDGKWPACETCILNWYKDHLDTVKYIASTKDSKTTLQEYLQARKSPLPHYRLVHQMGSGHDPTFTIACQLSDKNGLPYADCKGVGKSRREAEQQAASNCLALLSENYESYVNK